jgi:hypothetical protein
VRVLDPEHDADDAEENQETTPGQHPALSHSTSRHRRSTSRMLDRR